MIFEAHRERLNALKCDVTASGSLIMSRINLFPFIAYIPEHKKYLIGEPLGSPDRPEFGSPHTISTP